MVFGRGTGVTPIAVIASTIFWTWLWGPLGLLLAMPMTVCLAVLGRHVEGLEFLDVLLGDEPALTPAAELLPARADRRCRRGHLPGRACASRTRASPAISTPWR